jgi:hypothetical protein
MNYVDKMNSISNCATGLCECLEHKVNTLVWVVPVVIGIYLLSKVYNKCTNY